MFRVSIVRTWFRNYNCHDPSAQTAPATADSKQTDHNRDQSRPERDLVRDEVPLRDALVHLDCSGRSVSEHLVLELFHILFRVVDGTRDCVVRFARASRRLSSGSVQTELLDRIKDEAGLSVAAPVDVARGLVCGAVVPEVDAVGLLQLATGFGEGQSGCELGAVGQASSICGGKVGEVDGHEVVGVHC